LGQDVVGLGNQVEGQTVGRLPSCLKVADQAMADRQQDLDAPGARADDTDPGSTGAAEDTLPERDEPCGEAVDRFERYGQLCRPRYGVSLRTHTDVEGQKIEGDGRTVGTVDAPAREVDPRRLVVNEPGAGKPAERPEIDVDPIVIVMA